MNWKIVYLDKVEQWLDNLSEQKLKSISKELYLLGLCGKELKLPHSRVLGEGLFELRERRFGLRIYYHYSSYAEIILLNAGDKDSQIKDIKKARYLLKFYQEQANESKKFRKLSEAKVE